MENIQHPVLTRFSMQCSLPLGVKVVLIDVTGASKTKREYSSYLLGFTEESSLETA